jgi:hypothetical protein
MVRAERLPKWWGGRSPHPTCCGAIWSTVFQSGGGTTSDTTYNFTCGNDGANPTGVVFGPSHSLLGVARNGGANSAGTVFQITQITPP